MSSTRLSVLERTRVETPFPRPLGVAYDGTALWVGSGETDRLYRFDPHSRDVLEEAPAPGSVYGLAAAGDEVTVVIGDAEDDRSIARYVRGRGFDATAVPCPGATGSWIARDDDRLFLSQRFAKRIVELDAAGAIKNAVPVAREITGMTLVDGAFYLVTTESRDVDDYRLIRLDARGERPVEFELASFPFAGARGLAYDGSAFWTSIRETDTLVAFALP